MTQYGSLFNRLYDAATDKPPEVGDGATVLGWSDRTAGTVIEVSRTGHKIRVQEDKATRTDTNGMSDAQSYSYERDPNGRTYTATRRRDGSYRLKGGQQRVLIGGRSQFFDYSF